MTGPHFRLTPRAEEDLRQIGRYTLKKWGRDQRNTYLRDINRCFGWLVENPKRGRHRPDIAPDYYSFPHGSHLIFYMIFESGIDIIGVSHQAMDILTYMASGDPDWRSGEF